MADNTTLPGTGEIIEDIDIGGGVKRQVITFGARGGATTECFRTGALQTVGFIANPTSVYTRPADTTAYAIGDLVSNNVTAGSVTVQSIAAGRIAAGQGLLRRARLVTNHTTGLADILFKLRFWSAAPTYTNGDNGAYAVATGGANFLGAMFATFEQFADAAVAIGVPAVGSELAFALASGTAIFWDMEARTVFTPQSGKTFTLAGEVVQY